jgi:nucleoside-diphosphate-sugar epimerase
MSQSETVVVTGGSGYIGSWCIIDLLRRGYSVRATVRDLAKAGGARATIERLGKAGDRLSFHEAELTADRGWNEAIAGADYVLHVASPLGVPPPKNANELIVPARDGAARVIGAAIRAGVKRVVMTSSVAAASPPFDTTGATLTDESTWSDRGDTRISAYARSKTIAEREAWDLIASSGGATSLTTVNPSLVLGPVLSKDFSGSVQVVQRLLSGRIPGIPRLGFNIVDVRDVADLHIRCMSAPEAAGQRFIAAGEFAWMGDLARMLRTNLGPEAAKVPTRNLPDIAMRAAALVDRDLATVVPDLGRKRDFSSEKARLVLHWTPRPLKTTIMDCAKSLIAIGAV